MSKRFGVGEVIGDYGILVYDNLLVCFSNSSSVYVEGMMAIPVSKIMKWALHVQFETPCGRTILIYYAQSCSMRLIIHAHYKPDHLVRSTDAELNKIPHLYFRNNA